MAPKAGLLKFTAAFEILMMMMMAMRKRRLVEAAVGFSLGDAGGERDAQHG